MTEAWLRSVFNFHRANLGAFRKLVHCRYWTAMKIWKDISLLNLYILFLSHQLMTIFTAVKWDFFPFLYRRHLFYT